MGERSIDTGASVFCRINEVGVTSWAPWLLLTQGVGVLLLLP